MTAVHVVCSVLLYTIFGVGMVLGATFITLDAHRRLQAWKRAR